MEVRLAPRSFTQPWIGLLLILVVVRRVIFVPGARRRPAGAHWPQLAAAPGPRLALGGPAGDRVQPAPSGTLARLSTPAQPLPPGDRRPVADAVAERGGSTARQRAVEAQRLGPGEQIRSGQRQLQPDSVLVIAFAGKVAQPGCLAGPDPVFDPGVG